MRILVTGATGLIGKRLVKRLAARGEEVVVLSRDAARAEAALSVKAFAWDSLAGPPPPPALAGVEAIIHLAGESVAGGRWTDARKQAIRDSRITGTRNLVAGIAALEEKSRPRVLVSASAVGWYGDRPGDPVDESAPAGSDFLATVVQGWEKEAAAAEALGVRVVRVRIGVVVAPPLEGGALAKMVGPFRMGVGGRTGKGTQGFPWVHIDDVVGLALHALDNPLVKGPMNAVAPTPVDNRAFAKALGRALHRPTFLPTPGFAIKLLFGEMAEVLLGGQLVTPRVARETGYSFAHADVDEALADVLPR